MLNHLPNQIHGKNVQPITIVFFFIYFFLNTGFQLGYTVVFGWYAAFLFIRTGLYLTPNYHTSCYSTNAHFLYLAISVLVKLANPYQTWQDCKGNILERCHASFPGSMILLGSYSSVGSKYIVSRGNRSTCTEYRLLQLYRVNFFLFSLLFLTTKPQWYRNFGSTYLSSYLLQLYGIAHISCSPLARYVFWTPGCCIVCPILVGVHLSVLTAACTFYQMSTRFSSFLVFFFLLLFMLLPFVA